MEFLDSVLESTRAKELAVKEETREQLEVFRKQQEEADKKAIDASGGDGGGETAGSPTGESSETQWAVNARKRKRIKEDNRLKGGKIQKSSSASVVASLAAPNPDGSPWSKDKTSEDRPDTKSKITKAPEGTSSAESASSPHTVKKDVAVPSLQSKATDKTDTTKPSGLSRLGLADYTSDED